MTPIEYTHDLMKCLREDGFFEANMVEEKHLAIHVKEQSEWNLRYRGTECLTKKDISRCLQAAAVDYIDAALTKFSELGLLTVLVQPDGSLMYEKDIDRAKELGYL